MVAIILGKGSRTPPECPLCKRKMMYRTTRLPNPDTLVLELIEVFICEIDQVMIRCDDPSVGLWQKHLGDNEPVPCPNPKCGHEDIPVFYTENFEFFKAVCPRCHASVASDNISQLEDMIKRMMSLTAEQKLNEKQRRKKNRGQ